MSEAILLDAGESAGPYHTLETAAAALDHGAAALLAVAARAAGEAIRRGDDIDAVLGKIRGVEAARHAAY